MSEQPQKRADYSSPPVIEIYVEVKFAPSEEKEGWGLDAVQPLVEELSDRFGQQKQITKRTVHLKEGEGTEPQIEWEDEVLDRVQLFSNDGTKCIQIGEDLLVCNFRKVGNYIPHYRKTIPTFRQALETYLRQMRPSGVQWHALNYVDLFHIPESRFDLDKYFRFGLDMPESMPDLTAFNYDCQFKISEGQRLSIQWQDVSGEEGAKFRQNWKLTSSDCEEMRPGRIVDSISKMHYTLYQFFEESITDETRALFRGDKR